MRRNVVKVMMGFFVTIVFGIVGCGGGSNNDSTPTAGETDSVTITAGSAGAIAKTPSGNASIDIPASALTNNLNMSIAVSEGGDLPGTIGASYEFGPNGTTFNIPVTITLKYDVSLIPEGSSEQDLVIAYEANGGWVELSNPEIDSVNKVIKAKTSHFSKYAVTQKKYPGGYGGLLGSFNNVNVYSNGDPGFGSDDYNNYNGTNTGMKWQCVEFVNRYYLQVYNMNIRIAGDNANDYYRKASDRGLVAYSNGIVGTVEPQVGDIIVSEGTTGNVGHVAIVRKVTSDKIYLVQQNYLNTQSDADGSFLFRNGNAIKGFGGNYTSYPIKGWLRKPDNTSTTQSNNGTKASYYPMTTGSTWTYNLKSGSTVATGTFKIQSDGKWKLTNNIDADVVYSTYKIINNAVYATVQESILGNGTTTTTMSPPMLIFPSDLTSGATQTSSFNIDSGEGVVKITVIGQENVTVPAGTFDAVKIKMVISDGGSENLTTYGWYAFGVGKIKYTYDNFSQELKSYSIN